MSFLRWKKKQEQLADEIANHLQMSTQDRVDRGESPEGAVQAARREFGNVSLVRQVTRDQWRWRWLDELAQDLRYAARTLHASPLFTLAVILSLALGIGANTAIFTLLHASLWKPLPINDPMRIFHLMRTSSEGDFAGEFSCSYPLFQQFAQTARPWGEVFATSQPAPRKFGLDIAANERIAGEAVSSNFFAALQIQPMLGRLFEPTDDNVLGGNHVVVLSEAFWRRRFQSDRSILGKSVFYEEEPYVVVGVAQPGFFGIAPEFSVDAWVPATASIDKTRILDPNSNWLRLLARLQSHVDVSHAQGIFEGILRAHIAETLLPGASPRWRSMLETQHLTLRPARSGLATTGRRYEKPLLVLLAVVAVVLLISCANIANLILARNAARRHEVMVRLALGASRWRIARQLLTENLLLSFAGAACALFLAVWGTRLLLSLLPRSPLPLAFDLRPDFAVFGFTAACALVTAALFGFGPALRAAGEKTEMSFRTSQRATASSSTGRLLLIGQLALSLPLLIGAGLFLQTLHNLKVSDLGFHPENVLTFDLSSPKGTSEDRIKQAYAQIKERLESHAGVIIASYSWPSVYGHGGWSGSITVPGRSSPNEDNDVGLISVGPGFFETIGLSLLQGRYLDSRDQAEELPVAVVNESLVRSYFGAESPIGKHIQLFAEPQVDYEIVGVVRDARHYGVRARVWRMVYLPTAKSWQGGAFFVRSSLNAQLLSGVVRSEVTATDKVLQVEKIQPFEAVVDEMISQERLTAVLSSIFAVLACLLAAIGLYGIVAYSVSRRTNEVGIRMALGAQRRDIRALVVRQTLPVILGGIAIGASVALGLARALSATIAGMLYGTQTTNMGLMVGSTVSLIAIALAAAYLPAQRATRIDPMVALRYE